MKDEQAKRACGYMAGQLSVKSCKNCQRAAVGTENIFCFEHQGMPVSYFGVCLDWKLREVPQMVMTETKGGV